ncbi:MAG TPA: hypothetical protein PK303_04735 [bacterium]|nr:hypothetical protein [bacterium]HOL35050.1 hypothetical protein [bacterium]HPP08411.1 hypothetical protein [bacterium]
MIFLVFFFKGFAALCAQSLLLREFYIVLHGNELSFGIVLSIWVISGATGSFLVAKNVIKKNPSTFYFLTIFEGFWLFISLALIRLCRTIFHIFPGQMLNIPQLIELTLITAGIFNFSQGIRFVIGGSVFRRNIKREEIAGLLYGFEAAGALIGGLVFAFLLQKHTNPFQTSAIIVLANMISNVPLLSFFDKKIIKISMAIFYFIVLFLFVYPVGFYSKLNILTLMKQWNIKSPPVFYKNTHYGNITVIESDKELSFMLDGSLLFTAPYPDVEWIENTSHFPLLYAKKTEHILVIGAGIKGIIPEIVKYRPKTIDCVEINPELISVIKQFSSSYFPEYQSGKINVIEDDAIDVFRKTRKQWDVIILDAGFPFSLKIANFYTKEFYNLVKAHLSQDGIFYTQLPGSPEYMSESLADIHRIMYLTLKNVFPSVYVIPGYFTGYCAAVSPDMPEFSYSFISSQLRKKQIHTTVITNFYLSNRLDEEKIHHFLEMIGENRTSVNTQLKPIIVIPAIRYWISMSATDKKSFDKNHDASSIILSVIFLVSAVIYILKKPVKTRVLELTMFSTGFLSIAWELIYLFLFQVNYGSVYFYLSILTGIFMGGMAAGSVIFSIHVKKLKNASRNLFLWQMIQIIFSIAGIGLAILLTRTFLSAFIFFIVMAVAGFLAGWEFPLINSIYLTREKTITDSMGRFYAADLIGATTGSLLTATVLVPNFGILTTCMIFVVIKIIMAVFVRTVFLK